MAEEQKNFNTRDPSINVIRLVGDTTKYLESMINIIQKNMEEKLKLHMEYMSKASEAESLRINASRAVDLRAVEVANDRANKQAEVLANQMTENAETLRASVEKTAAVIAAQLQQITTQFTDRLTALEKVQYETQGKAGASDSLIKDVADLKMSEANRNGSTGISLKLQIVIATTIGGVITGIIILLVQGLAT